jgi:putative flippase GtrA
VKRYGKALLAVLLGNIIYFAILPKLPLAARHVPFRIDLGLLVDSCICIVAFLVVNRLWRSR